MCVNMDVNLFCLFCGNKVGEKVWNTDYIVKY